MFEYLHDMHKGQTALIIGNGPSLGQIPDEYFTRYRTIGCNRIYLRWFPDYYVVINQLLIEQYRKEINAAPIAFKFVREGSGVLNSFPLHLVETPMFSFAPTRWLWDGHNTTYVMLQLAFFMGFSTVKLVGVDHRYEYEGEPNQELLMVGDDPNHFDPTYFKGAKWQAPDLEVSEKAYLMAKEAYEHNGRKIINLTPASSLTIFERGAPEW